MKTRYILIFFSLLCSTITAQSVMGKWITVDENGIEKSVVEIYEENQKLFGKIVDILDSNDKDALCSKCKDDEFNTPILGLTIIKGLSFDGNFYRNGTIFDPEKGKSFKCRLSLGKDSPDVLEVRGYIAFMYETQYWKRAKR